MKPRWAAGFTIVELLIVIVVIAILIIIAVVAYSNVTRSTDERAVQSDLRRASAEMARENVKGNGVYPTSLPATAQPSDDVSLELVRSGPVNFYPSLTSIQGGVLLSEICEQLVEEGVGQGVDQGGTTRDYITGCGNWNDDSMQVTGWDSRVYGTPVSKQTLLSYADGYTVSNTWHKAAQETAVKTFYRSLINRFEMQGGTFPITSFWDYWATSSNGGVMKQDLPPPSPKQRFCLQGSSDRSADVIWHVTEADTLQKGGC
jgi:prepilin-type N-terminal cleavage/methylation domain-containing protein